MRTPEEIREKIQEHEDSLKVVKRKKSHLNQKILDSEEELQDLHDDLFDLSAQEWAISGQSGFIRCLKDELEKSKIYHLHKEKRKIYWKVPPSHALTLIVDQVRDGRIHACEIGTEIPTLYGLSGWHVSGELRHGVIDVMRTLGGPDED